MTMRALLVRTQDRNILIDTGAGEKGGNKLRDIYSIDYSRYSIEGQLAEAGLKPEDITDVILTHLHFDHAGGAVKKAEDGLAPAFPMASHHVQRRQWEWALNPSDRDKASYIPDNYLPLREWEMLALHDGATELFPGFFLEVAEGHTPAQQLVRLRHAGRSLVYCADLVPMSAHIPAPYIMGYDLQPLLTLAEKQRLLDEAADKGDVLIFEHDPHTEAATITRTPKGFAALLKGSAEELASQAGRQES
jgi:glyoxylase-like metal-dependent hydrolase (beta-lactamase superfamily II)